MAKLRALVAAAGRGTRSGLAYPKTLFLVRNKPILAHIFELLSPYDTQPTVIVSPEGESSVSQCLDHYGLTAHIAIQPKPNGMGDAVLCFTQSPAFVDAEHVLLIWGDIPFIQPATVFAMVDAHLRQDSDFTFVTRRVSSAYTVVTRNISGQVTGVIETREQSLTEPQSGEREIGLFVFRKELVMDSLREELAGKWGPSTGEHGFLYVIRHLAARGFCVEALPIGTELDLVSLNSLKDIDAFL